MSATITNATATLADGDLAALSTMLVADLAEHGVLDSTVRNGDRNPDGGYQVGDLVAIYAHQRTRVARVWKVGRTKVSAVYVTPSEVDAAGKVRRMPYPNNITAEPVALIARNSQPAEVAPAAGGAELPVPSVPAYPGGWLPIGAELEGALF
jgi:hypothetical protein